MISRPARSLTQPAQPVDGRLVDVLDDGEATGRVAVERGVADGHLALVACRQHQPAELVGQRHEQHPADAALQVLLGEIGLEAGEGRSQQLEERRRRRARWRSSGSRTRWPWPALRRPSGSRRSSSATASTRRGRDPAPRASAAMAATSDESMPPDRPEHDVPEAVLERVVAQAEDDGVVHLVDVVPQRGAATEAARRRAARACSSLTTISGQRRPGLPAPRVEQALAVDGVDVEVHHQQVLDELRAPGPPGRPRRRRPSRRRRRPARPARRPG